MHTVHGLVASGLGVGIVPATDTPPPGCAQIRLDDPRGLPRHRCRAAHPVPRASRSPRLSLPSLRSRRRRAGRPREPRTSPTRLRPPFRLGLPGASRRRRRRRRGRSGRPVVHHHTHRCGRRRHRRPALPVERRFSERYARDSDAVRVGRSRAANRQISLSPNTIRRTAAPRRLVLPSPNGSTISFELGTGTGVCVGASLRNATAVADWIARHCTSTSVVSVIAAGEKWPGGELRPAIEDLWGGGRRAVRSDGDRSGR